MTCFPENRRPVAKYGPKSHPEFEGAVGAACNGFNAKDKKFWDKSEAHSWAWDIVDRKTTYWFNIGWKEGCTLPNNDNPQSQHMIYPLGKKGHICEDIFIKDVFQSCVDKGGRGGHIKAGCLVYAFEPCDADDCFNTGKRPPSMAPNVAPRNGQ
ncbi:hypothetical protein FQN53_008881 [Emmonsiellopsis sp. PD_33]|nr:hypothetical protein FQN53_008881 [Emmonsiellopsis sp. PD_33]